MSLSHYSLTADGETCIENFQATRPFSSFFPGIAGPHGVPLWAFYVNRGQGIASFGIESKEKAMLEFFPANRAYQLTALVGFRTFLKIDCAGRSTCYEPFQSGPEKKRGNRQRMIFSPAALTLEETHGPGGLQMRVEYMTVPGETFPGLLRQVTLKNNGPRPLTIEGLDGLPWVNSYGIGTWIQKFMSRTAEAWVGIENIETGAPFYKLKVDTADKPETEYIRQGYFASSFDAAGPLSLLIDPRRVFGQETSLKFPAAFYGAENFHVPTQQAHENFTPCAMTHFRKTLKPGSEYTVHSIYGYAPSVNFLNRIRKRISNPGWFQAKKTENTALIRGITNSTLTFSSHAAYDQYCRQTFLDNVLRGGLPVSFPGNGGAPHVFHIYSRKHGDLERDYNQFYLQTSYFSQGNGNYRDVNQNRRNDCWFHPDVGRSNIRTFINLLQLDGYNPLVIKSACFQLVDFAPLQNLLTECIRDPQHRSLTAARLSRPFSPGPLLGWMFEEEIELTLTPEAFLARLLPHARRMDEAAHGEGFWSDHWTYNLDLIENYLSVFPEEAGDLLFRDHDFSTYQNAAWVNPRKIRYVLRHGKPFQTRNVAEDEHLLKNQSVENSWVRTRAGEGDIYRTSLMAKLVGVVTNKIATLDPSGVGIEFEGGKPNWYDSLNGLPGLFGSSTNETIELKRLILFCKRHLESGPTDGITLHRELCHFLEEVQGALAANLQGDVSDFIYWDRTATAKESYRETVKSGIHGEEINLSCAALLSYLDLGLRKCDRAIDKAYQTGGEVIPSYFINTLTRYEVVEDAGGTVILPLAFEQTPCPLFLEGPVHQLKLAGPLGRSQYEAIRRSPLYDSTLKMYKLNDSLQSMPPELGRCTVFPPGWLENESIWMHMEYKFFLELLRSGLHDEFFRDFKNAAIPFLDPERYGRSILENSSFIVSSAYPDAALHGSGFVARLSGSTAEFLHIWLFMNLGTQPIRLGPSGELEFHPQPILPSWLFAKSPRRVTWNWNGETLEATLPENHFAFLLFGATLVIYHNPRRKNTYGKDGVKTGTVKLLDKQGQLLHPATGLLRGDVVRRLRSREIPRLEIELGPT